MIAIDKITDIKTNIFSKMDVDIEKRKELLKKLNDILTDNNNLRPDIDPTTGAVTLKDIDPTRASQLSQELISTI